ncbi:hypothetical protein DY000_02047178 [Brassica cretica]|uniref:Uncharacterized protein n=1 Tax=Brassica cretica TaxID=69181 RepID=A0ABQ7EWP6_BRACR|nr:hypothetical protein DY000_02047178 [Brassica cretica]
MLVRMTVWSSKKVFLSRKEISSKNESSGVSDGISLSPVFGKHSGLTTDVRSKNCCSCLDLICDRGVRTKGFPFGRQVIGAVVAQLFWLCMKAVLSFIAKDVVAKGLDHDTFLLSIREIKPKKLDTEPVRGQLRGDFLLGRDQAE